MFKHELDFTIEQLADQAGVPTRTIRYYITEGLLPGPKSRGKAATYTEEHLLRLRLIRRLAEQRVPIREIRDRLSGLPVSEIRTILAEDDQRAAQLQRSVGTMSPKEYVSALLSRARESRSGISLREATVTYPAPPKASALARSSPSASQSHTEEAWCRWELESGVELHVRADVRDRNRKLIDRILRAAGVPAQRDNE